MKMNSQTPDDAKLRALLRESRLAPELPPGFQDAVWRRLERAEAPAANWLDAPAAWFLPARPSPPPRRAPPRAPRPRCGPFVGGGGLPPQTGSMPWPHGSCARAWRLQ